MGDCMLFLGMALITASVIGIFRRPQPHPPQCEPDEMDELVWLMVSPWEWIEVPLSEAWDCGGVFLFENQYQAMRAAEAEREFWRAVAEDE